MLSKISKILGIIFGFLLLIIFLTNSEDIGFFLLIGAGLFTLVTSISIADDVKKLRNPKASRILSLILIDLILYGAIMLSYGLGNIGVGDKGFLAMGSFYLYSILLGISLLIGIFLVLMDKTQTVQARPNKVLFIILVVMFIPLTYNFLISELSRLVGNHALCSLQLEMNDSFIFLKGAEDSCIMKVAVNNSDTRGCELVPKKDRISCLMKIAWKLEDADICQQISEKDRRQSICIEHFARLANDS